MSYQDFYEDLKNKTLHQMYLFYGQEDYLMESTIHKVEKECLDEGLKELNYQYIDGKETSVDHIINACETLPFMSDKRIVCIRDLECFLNKKKNINDEEEGRLIKYLENVPKTTYLFFIITQDLDKRKKIFKVLKKYGKVVVFDKLSQNDVSKWVQKTFKNHHKTIGRKEIHTFLDRSTYLERYSDKTLKDLKNEIDKLCSYVGERMEIATKDIELLAPKSLQNNIFELVDGVSSKNAGKALKILEDMLLDGESEIKILYMIIRQFRYLFQIKSMEKQGYTPMAIAPKLGLRQFVVKKYLNQARNFSIQTLKNVLHRCLCVDKDMKTGKMNQRLALELLITQFAA